MKSSGRHPVLGWLVVATGFYPLAIAVGLLDPGTSEGAAPVWVLFSCAAVFIVGGSMALTDSQSKLRDLGAAVICFCFAAIGIWVSVFSPSEGFSGGIPFLAQERNVLLGRWMFGLGALMSTCIAVYAAKRFADRSGGE